MPNCLTASVLFRAYVKRLPSGVYRVTVLSTALPRPLFRSYPVELGEAVAVERSVGHALCALQQRTQNEREQRNKPSLNAVFAAPDETAENDSHESNRQRHGLIPTVNVVIAHPYPGAFPAAPHGDDGVDTNATEHEKHGDSDVKHVLRHGSPRDVQRRPQNAAVRSEEQEGAEGYAVEDGHGSVVQLVKNFNGNKICPESGYEPRPPLVVPIEVDQKSGNLACNYADANNYKLPAPQPTQHLRLRVVWQGLLS